MHQENKTNQAKKSKQNLVGVKGGRSSSRQSSSLRKTVFVKKNGADDILSPQD